VHPIGESAMDGPAGHRGVDGRPAGNWEVTGRGFEGEGPGPGVPRTFPARHWRFESRCDKSGCRTLFLRTTGGGIQRTVLHAHRGYFAAKFGPVPEPCEGVPGRPGNYTARFVLRWSNDGGKLVARERGHYGGRCTPGWTRTRWTANAAPARDGSLEASEQVL
jgi:hypothetical protein